MANKKYKTFGRVAEWLKATDCKFVELFLRRFESYLSQQFLFALNWCFFTSRYLHKKGKSKKDLLKPFKKKGKSF